MRFKVAEVTGIERDEDGFVINQPTIGPAIHTFEAAYPAAAMQTVRQWQPSRPVFVDAGLSVTCAWKDGDRVLALALDK